MSTKRPFPILRHKKLLVCFLLLIMGILYYMPRFLMDGIPHYLNEDTYFHLSRIIGLRNVWTSPVNFLNFAHNGPAVNIFYPWLTMYPMYILFRLTDSYVLSYKLYYLLLTITTLFISYYVMYRISDNWLSSFSFAVLYTYSAYRFINVFRRAHLGESISMTALLFVLLGVYCISFGDYKRWGALAVGMALIAYSHNLFLLITSFTVGFYVLLSIWFWNMKKERLISFVKAAGTALFFSLGSFIPILEYMKTNQLYTPGGSGQGLEDTAFSLKQIIESSLRNQPVSYAAGFLVIAAIICLVFFYCINTISGRKISTNRGIDLLALTGLIVFLAASTLLPWRFIGDHSPFYTIQFVWRLNAHSTILILGVFSFYLPKLLRSNRLKILAAVSVIMISIILHYNAVLTLHKEENTRISEADISAGNSITFDYAPVEAKGYRSQYGYTLDDTFLNQQPLPTEVTFSEDGTTYFTEFIPPSADTKTLTADIPVFRYTSQQCTLNGEKITASLSDRGTTLIEIPADRTNIISISYRHSKLTYASWAVSAAAAFLFIYYHLYKHRKNTAAK